MDPNLMTFLFLLGDFETALELTNYILSFDATREQMRDTKYYLERMVSDGIKAGFMHEMIPQAGDYHVSWK